MAAPHDIAKNICDFLEEHGHTVDYAADGVTGLHLAVTERFDAILLDVALPGMSGLDICSKLRSEARSDTPILMLTARDRLEDKLAGFESGADDYLAKPFNPRELVLRINNILKRGGQPATPKVEQVVFGPFTFVIARRELKKSGEPVRLTDREREIMERLKARRDHLAEHRDKMTTAIMREEDFTAYHAYWLAKAIKAKRARLN